jgi:hypothetical protein
MKYLKKFNEELRPYKYKNVARKLKQILKDKPALGKAIDAEGRANKLELHAKNMEDREHITLWEKYKRDFSKYGEFNIELSRPGAPSIFPKVYSFYIIVIPEVDMIIDGWDDWDSDNRDIDMTFCIGLIPKNIEDIEDIKKNYNGDFYNGFFLALWVTPRYKVVNSEVSFDSIVIDDYDSSPKHQIADRKTAVSLKRLLVNIFTPTFEYPSGYKDIPNIYDKIEQSVIQGLEISVNYGIDMERLREDIKNQPIISFYKQ